MTTIEMVPLRGAAVLPCWQWWSDGVCQKWKDAYAPVDAREIQTNFSRIEAALNTLSDALVALERQNGTTNDIKREPLSLGEVRWTAAAPCRRWWSDGLCDEYTPMNLPVDTDAIIATFEAAKDRLNALIEVVAALERSQWGEPELVGPAPLTLHTVDVVAVHPCLRWRNNAKCYQWSFNIQVPEDMRQVVRNFDDVAAQVNEVVNAVHALEMRSRTP